MPFQLTKISTCIHNLWQSQSPHCLWLLPKTTTYPVLSTVLKTTPSDQTFSVETLWSESSAWQIWWLTPYCLFYHHAIQHSLCLSQGHRGQAKTGWRSQGCCQQEGGYKFCCCHHHMQEGRDQCCHSCHDLGQKGYPSCHCPSCPSEWHLCQLHPCPFCSKNKDNPTIQ